MKLTLLRSLILSGILAFTAACNKECEDCPKPGPSADVTKPVITVITPVNDAVVTTGQNMTFTAKFTDDRELSQFRLDIHSSNDGHSHGKLSGAAVPFSLDTIVNLVGVNTESSFPIFIPADAAAGLYHVIVTAVDKAGNEAEFVETDVHFLNPSDTIAPLVTMVYPDFSLAEIIASFPAGQDTLHLRVMGTLTDAGNGGAPGNLKGYKITFTEEHGHAHAEEPVYELHNSNLSGSLHALDATLILRRSDLENNGTYELKVYTNDYTNNSSFDVIDCKVILN